MNIIKRWQDGANIILGIWSFFSPWILGFGTEPPYSVSFFVVGIAFIVFAGIGLSHRTRWEEWVNFILGIWMIISPWVLAFNSTAVARDNAVVIGLLVAVFSVWAIADQHIHGTPAGAH